MLEAMFSVVTFSRHVSDDRRTALGKLIRQHAAWWGRWKLSAAHTRKAIPDALVAVATAAALATFAFLILRAGLSDLL